MYLASETKIIQIKMQIQTDLLKGAINEYHCIVGMDSVYIFVLKCEEFLRGKVLVGLFNWF